MNDPSDTSVPGPYTALLMAGSRGPSDPVATFCGISHKALADIAGLPMVEHVLRTLADAREVGRIIAVIEAPELIEALPTARQLTEQGRLIVTTAAPSPSRRSSSTSRPSRSARGCTVSTQRGSGLE